MQSFNAHTLDLKMRNLKNEYSEEIEELGLYLPSCALLNVNEYYEKCESLRQRKQLEKRVKVLEDRLNDLLDRLEKKDKFPEKRSISRNKIHNWRATAKKGEIVIECNELQDNLKDLFAIIDSYNFTDLVTCKEISRLFKLTPNFLETTFFKSSIIDGAYLDGCWNDRKIWTDELYPNNQILLRGPEGNKVLDLIKVLGV